MSIDRWDILVIVGILATSIGAGMVSVPAGVITFGVLAIAAGTVGSVAQSKAKSLSTATEKE